MSLERGDTRGMAETKFCYTGTELTAMAAAPNYYRGILSRFAPYLGSHTIEVGAGVGTFASLLASEPAIERLTLIEPAANNYPILSERFQGSDRISVIHGYLSDCAEGLRGDALVLVNVLEHIEDDRRFMRDARRVLDPSGRLLIFVPAMPSIYGALDRALDHYRRYTRDGLRRLLEGSGFRIRELYYMNLPGALSWFIHGRVLRRRTLAATQVRLYDRWVIPWVVRMESSWKPPLGQSLLAVAEVA